MRTEIYPETLLPADRPELVIPENRGRVLLILTVANAPAVVGNEKRRVGPSLATGTLILDVRQGCQASWYLYDPTGLCTIAWAEIVREEGRDGPA